MSEEHISASENLWKWVAAEVLLGQGQRHTSDGEIIFRKPSIFSLGILLRQCSVSMVKNHVAKANLSVAKEPIAIDATDIWLAARNDV